jgi:hypothetical protein
MYAEVWLYNEYGRLTELLMELLERARQGLRHLLFDVDVEGAEITCSLSALVWGAFLATPLHSYLADESLSPLLPIWLWAFLFFFVALNHITALVTDTLALRRMMSLCDVALWIFVAYACQRASGTPIAFGQASVLAVSAAVCFWRLSRRQTRRGRPNA